MNKLQAEQCVELAKRQGISAFARTIIWGEGDSGTSYMIIGEECFKDYLETIGYLAIQKSISENLL